MRDAEIIALDRHRILQTGNNDSAVHDGKRFRHKVAKDKKRDKRDNDQRADNSDDNF
jgi:hypothetical protein